MKNKAYMKLITGTRSTIKELRICQRVLIQNLGSGSAILAELYAAMMP